MCFSNDLRISSAQPNDERQVETAGVLFQNKMKALGASGVKSLILFFFGMVACAYTSNRAKQISNCPNRQKDSFHDFAALDLSEKYIPFKRYEGKVVLVVNVATF